MSHKMRHKTNKTNKTNKTIGFIRSLIALVTGAAILAAPMFASASPAGAGATLADVGASRLVVGASGQPVADMPGLPANLADMLDSGASPVELTMSPGVAGFLCDGEAFASPAPIWLDDALFVPLRAVAEAFGASIDYLEQGEDRAGSAGSADSTSGSVRPPVSELGWPRIKGEFMANEFAFSFDAGYILLNGEAVDFPERLRAIDGVTYVPLRILDLCLGTVSTYDGAQDSVTIRLADDGNIRDFSDLLGEIREAAVGDSYYNWRIDVPRKSMLVSSSFNGDTVYIYSPLRDALIEIIVRPSEGRSPEYYLEDHDAISEDYYVIAAQVVGSGAAAYVQAILGDYYGDEAALARIYPRRRYDYIVTIIAMPDMNGDYLINPRDFYFDNPYSRILDTFDTRWPDTGEGNIRDLAKVIDGRIHYINYIDIPGNRSLLTPWAISVLPEWGFVHESFLGESIITVLGDYENEISLTVAMERMPPQVTADEYLDNYPDIMAAKFNRDALRIKDIELRDMDGAKVLDYSYELLLEDGEKYIYYERLIPAGAALYRLRLGAPEPVYQKSEADFIGAIDSFETNAGDLPLIAKYLESHAEAIDTLRIADFDEPAPVGGADVKWSSMLPGGWLDSGGWYSVAVIGYEGLGYYDLATGARVFAQYELYDDEEMEYFGDEIITSIDYAQYLYDEVSDLSDIMGILFYEPELVSHGGYEFAMIGYSSETEYFDFDQHYPGLPVVGNIYLLADEDGVYFIFIEIPYVFDTPLNRLAFDMFLDYFTASGMDGGGKSGDGGIGLGSDSGSNNGNGPGASDSSAQRVGTQRPGAVG